MAAWSCIEKESRLLGREYDGRLVLSAIEVKGKNSNADFPVLN